MVEGGSFFATILKAVLVAGVAAPVAGYVLGRAFSRRVSSREALDRLYGAPMALGFILANSVGNFFVLSIVGWIFSTTGHAVTGTMVAWSVVMGAFAFMVAFAPR